MPIMVSIGGSVISTVKKYTTKAQEVYAHAGVVAEQAFSGIRTLYYSPISFPLSLLLICSPFSITSFRYAFSLQDRFCELYNSRLVFAERSEARRGLVYGMGIGSYFFVQYSIYGM